MAKFSAETVHSQKMLSLLSFCISVSLSLATLMSCVKDAKMEPSLIAGITEVNSIDATDNEFQDLMPLKAMVNQSDIIAIGEPAHTSVGFYNAKFRLIRFLIERDGVRTIAFEDSFRSVESINNYVLRGEGTPKDAIGATYRVWHSDVLVKMIEWIRAYNLKHVDDPVNFVGFDLANGAETAALLKQSKNEVNNSVQENLIQCAKKLDTAPKFERTDCDRCLALQSSLSKTSTNIDDFLQISYKYSVRRLCSFDNVALRNSIRDEAMALFLKKYINNLKSKKKMVVWSANGHIAKKALDQKEKPMGDLISAEFGKRYVAINIVAERYDTFSDWKFIKPQLKATVGSPEEWLSTYDREYLFVDLSKVEPEVLGLSSNNKELATMFVDGIFYMRYSPAMKLFE